MIYWYILKLINNTWIMLRKSLSALKWSKLYCKLKKYEFGKLNIKYLGHKIIDSIVLVDPAKIEAISTWPEPSCVG